MDGEDEKWQGELKRLAVMSQRRLRLQTLIQELIKPREYPGLFVSNQTKGVMFILVVCC